MATVTAPQSPSKPVVISERKEQIIRACLRYQYLTVVDLCFLLGLPNSRNYVRRLASRLAGNSDHADGHYLYRFALPQRTGGNARRVFVPGTASHELLRQTGEAPAAVIKPATLQGYSYSYVVHNLAVARLAVCATLLYPEYVLAEIRLWSDLAARPPRVSLGAAGEETTIAVIPDCWVYLQRLTDGRGHVLWFEVDNATEAITAFKRRVRARIALIASEAYAAYFGTPAVLLTYAVIGTDQKRREERCETLRQWTKAVLVQDQREDWAGTFRFAAIDYETLYEQQDALFLKPIWQLPDEPNPVALLTPPETEETPHDPQTTSHIPGSASDERFPPQAS